MKLDYGGGGKGSTKHGIQMAMDYGDEDYYGEEDDFETGTTAAEDIVIGSSQKEQPKKQAGGGALSANHLLGFIKEDPNQVAKMGPRAPGGNRKKKASGYSKMAKGRGNYDYEFDKEKFVQASMKFVLKNPVEDGGCKIDILQHTGEMEDD